MTDDLTQHDHSALATATVEQLHDFTDKWLANRRLSVNTQEAYRRDIREYLHWCDETGLPPLQARFTHINTYGRWLEQTPGSWTGKLPKPATVARKLAAISSWYDFLAAVEAIPANPAARIDRPRIDRDHTVTVGFGSSEAGALIQAARSDEWMPPGGGYALAVFMVDMGARVSEVCGVNLDDLGYQEGHRTVLLRMKGDKQRKRSMPPALIDAMDTYLTARGEPTDPAAAVFVRTDGQRINRQEVLRFVRRVAKVAGLPNADRLSPHSFRHAWATIAKERGASLETRQHVLGHADPRTTQGYDRAKAGLDQDPSHLVAAAVAEVSAKRS